MWKKELQRNVATDSRKLARSWEAEGSYTMKAVQMCQTTPGLLERTRAC